METAEGEGRGEVLRMGFHGVSGWRVPPSGHGHGCAFESPRRGPERPGRERALYDRQHAAEDYRPGRDPQRRKTPGPLARGGRAEHAYEGGVLAGWWRLDRRLARNATLGRAG